MATLCGKLLLMLFLCYLIYFSNCKALFMLKLDWNRRKKPDTGNDCLISVDGVDCMISKRYAKAFWSHKFGKIARSLRYEVGVSIIEGDIVWVSGGHLPGVFPDISIFRMGLLDALDQYERVIADDGYEGEAPQHVKIPKLESDGEVQQQQQRVRNCHESCNNRFKTWGCLRGRFRHCVTKHQMCFYAVAIITQLEIQNGYPLFDNTQYDEGNN